MKKKTKKNNKKNPHGSGHPLDLASHTTALIIPNEEMEVIMKIAKVVKGISEAIKNETTEQKGGFLPMN